MLVVDYERMRMPPPTMGAQMWMPLRQIGMGMQGRISQISRPEPRRHGQTQGRKPRHHTQSRPHAKGLPRPSRQRITHQPARMAERELRCE